MTGQLELLTTAGTLAETTLDMRHAGAVALLERDELDAADRLELLLLVVAPEAVMA
jgi:hypothetical protein